MKQGVVMLADKFNASVCKAEEIRTFVRGMADKFCEVTGLSVIKTVEHDFGGVCLVGESGKENAVLAIGNSSAATNKYYFWMQRVDVENIYNPNLTYAIDGKSIFFSSTNNYPVFMRYIKSGNSTVCYICTNKGNLVDVPRGFVTFIIGNVIKEDESFASSFFQKESDVYASYNPIIGNDYDSAVFSVGNVSYPVCPKSKDALIDIYIADAKLENIKLYTNKMGTAPMNIIEANGVKYAIASAKLTFCLALKLDEEA